jgi:flagellar basal body-associated protein FliL
MSGLVLLLVLVGLLTLVGSAALFFVTYKYYWGERGTPPLTGAERRRQKEAELQIRAKQIERARKNPVTPRSPDFWDNRKRP